MSRYNKTIAGVPFYAACAGGYLGLMGFDTKVHLRQVNESVYRWIVVEFDQVYSPALAGGRTQEDAVRRARALFLGQVRSFDVGGMPMSFKVVEGGFEVSDIYQKEVLLRCRTFREAMEAAANLVAARKQELEGA